MTKKSHKSNLLSKISKKSPSFTSVIVFSILLGTIFGLLYVLIGFDRSPTHGSIGESVGTQAYSIEVLSVERTQYRDVFTQQPIGNQEALKIRVAVTNTSATTQAFLPVNDVFLKDNFGSILRLKPVYGLESPIIAGNLEPGQGVTGDISFVLENAKGTAVLFFDPRWDASPASSIDL